ncbi:T9SS type A sorting domain-containing protein [Melioribacteraceae bacterium 4301-Me]|uniref:T9SS type A sorting domain-containing protein n=1 Tax=Pyranulibacter aquaticus TaxID=3163344 RepID=UPI0035987B03
MNRYLKWITKVFIYFFLFSIVAKAQIVIHQKIDIASGIKDSTIEWNSYPEINWNSIDKIFDDNPFTEAGVTNSDTLTITLNFLNTITFSKAKVFFFNDGLWSLESANSLVDLNNKTGSYISLTSGKHFYTFMWDSLEFSPVTVKYLRLSIKNPADTAIHLGELVLEKELKLTSLIITPSPPKVIPGTTLKTSLKVKDEEGNFSDYNLNYPVVYHSSDESIATVDASGNITGVSLGSCVVTVATEDGTLSGKANVQVLSDFTSQRAKTKIVKVALIIQDPIIPQFGNKRLHEKWNWTDPNVMVEQILDEFKKASDSTVIFQIVERHEDQNIFTKIDSSYMTINDLAYYFQDNYHLYTELKNIAETQGRIHYDYNGMIDFYNLDTKRNNGEIDEVWVYAFPFAGMYESILAGPGAFWWNAPPLSHPGLQKTLSIMGWNYERGVAEAMHSVGHRVESAMWHAFGRWDNKAANPNMWELFTRIDKDVPGKANVGNIHFPPNGQSDYDYGNHKVVITYADNWKRYPYLLNQSRQVDCSEWGCSQLGYMRWWFSHLPRYAGVTNGILNDWWYYAIDYYAAVDLAQNTPVVDVGKNDIGEIPMNYELYQNYPNPFNPTTTIRFTIPVQTKVKIVIYDTLGRIVKVLLDEEKMPGTYNLTWDGTNFHNHKVASGVYLYRIITKSFIETKKLILLK